MQALTAFGEIKMASSRLKKATKKDAQTALQEALEEANQLLENRKKPTKKKRFRIFRDPLTGRRKSHYPYKPRFQDDRKRPSSIGIIILLVYDYHTSCHSLLLKSLCTSNCLSGNKVNPFASRSSSNCG